MSETLGVRLRQRREQQGISLKAIADQTKIKSCLLEALERDDVSRWPTGIFRRAYFRSYAEAIGADVDVALREFLAIHPDPHDAGDAVDDAVPQARPGAAPPTRLSMILSAAMAATPWRRRTTASTPEVTHASRAQLHDVSEQRPASADASLDTEPIAPAGGAPPSELPANDEGNVQSADTPVHTAVGASTGPDLQAVARWCTSFARTGYADDLQPLLREAAQILGVRGLIIWSYDEDEERLRPALAHGYSRRVLNRLRPVDRDEDNPTATAFRLGSAVGLSDENSGALVVPLLGPDGCQGVLALELSRGGEHDDALRAAAAIVAAMLVPVLPASSQAAAPAATEARLEPPRVVVDTRAVPAPCR
jgi:cytoskeletal protein RodZ